MGKFNVSGARATGTSVIQTERVASGVNHEGGAGFARDTKSELFMLAVTNMVGEKTFYESADARDDRFMRLIHEVASDEENIKWLTGFAIWLRKSANMRTASLVLAAETVHKRLEKGFQGGNRDIINGVLQRPDEPGELIAYWMTNYGRELPMPVKRGVGDALTRMVSEKSALKYDSDSKAYRFADLLRLAHARTDSAHQNLLFQHLLNERSGKDVELPKGLAVLSENKRLRSLDAATIHELAKSGELADQLAAAGMTWESVPSLVNGPWTKELWEAIIPSMGYMALLRNLRNFDEVGVSDKVAAAVAARLSDPEEVAKSRQLPMRFLSAYRNAPSLRWAWPLTQALDASLTNVPRLTGKTLIMVDTSSSMRESFSERSSLHRWDAAVLFGLALAKVCDTAEVVSFSSMQKYWGDAPGACTKPFDLAKGESVLKAVERWETQGYFLGGGTDTVGALRKHVRDHDRVVLLTDEQAGVNTNQVSTSVASTVPMHTYNLAGYERGHAPSGSKNRYTSGGLSDAGFAQIGLLERGASAGWPWMK